MYSIDSIAALILRPLQLIEAMRNVFIAIAGSAKVFDFSSVGKIPLFNDVNSSDPRRAVIIHAPKKHSNIFFLVHIIEMVMNPRPTADHSQIGKTVMIDN